MTIHEVLAEGTKLLSIPATEAQIDTPSLDASLLLSEVLQISREKLIVNANEPITEPDRERFLKLLERRRRGECIAYILGRRDFRGLTFAVNHHVLVPRPDTETLVEAALEYIDSWQISKKVPKPIKNHSIGPKTGHVATQSKSLTLLDLCTGSGAIAISLKRERPFLSVTASDISAEALEVAALNNSQIFSRGGAENAETRGENNTRCSLTENTEDAEGKSEAVRFIQSDLFENISGKFDIIVSNPPYVPSGVIDTLAPELQREPRLALDGGGDGLVLVRKIISESRDHLVPGGVLLLEAGPEQMPVIRKLLEERGFSNIKVHRDLAGRERVISGKYN